MTHGPQNGASISRRAFIGVVSAGIVVAPSLPSAALVRAKAIAFDAFPIFDPRPITALARSYFPEQGEMLGNLWSTKLFEYTWLCTAADRYESFESLADASLRFAAETMQLGLPDRTRVALIGAYSRLDVWSDVKAALAKLRTAGVRLAILSNLSESALGANMRNAGITNEFEHVLSTDRVKRFKPAPAAYHMAIEAFGLGKDEVGFAAFGGWDAAGASWFGYRSAWVNRVGAPNEWLGPSPTIVSRGMEGVLALAGIA
jgi:2-haloacid dehalogenase